MMRNGLMKAPAVLALLAAGLLVHGSAQACSLAAWDNPATGAPVAGGSAQGIARYSGLCGMRAVNPGPSFVSESAQHNAEGGATPFRARFFVFTGISGASPVIFRALPTGGGGSVIDVTYNSGDGNFGFTVGGNTQTTAAGSAPTGGWVQVELTYQANQAFTASTRRLGVQTALPAGLTAGAATIDAVQLGIIANGGGTGTLTFDEYEASRAAGGGAPFQARPRGDANGDGVVSGPDIIQTLQAAAGVLTPVGQPDCNMDGVVSGPDIVCVVRVAAGAETP